MIQFGMAVPEIKFCRPMTDRAERYEIIKRVRCAVISKQAERHDVMNRQMGRGYAAVLTSVVIPLTCRLALPIPVGAAIGGMTTQPCGIVPAATMDRTPCTMTSAAAKVSVTDGAWHTLERLTALVTPNRHHASIIR